MAPLVECVSAMRSGSLETDSASAARAASRIAWNSSYPDIPMRPRASTRSTRARIASAARVGSGPQLPALR